MNYHLHYYTQFSISRYQENIHHHKSNLKVMWNKIFINIVVSTWKLNIRHFLSQKLLLTISMCCFIKECQLTQKCQPFLQNIFFVVIIFLSTRTNLSLLYFYSRQRFSSLAIFLYKLNCFLSFSQRWFLP